MPAKEFVIIQSFLYKPPFIFFSAEDSCTWTKAKTKVILFGRDRNFQQCLYEEMSPKQKAIQLTPPQTWNPAPLAMEHIESWSPQRHWLLQGQEWHYPRYIPEVWEEGDRAAWCCVWLLHLQGMHCVDVWPHAKSIKPWKVQQVTVITVIKDLWRGGCKSVFFSHGI